MNQSSEGTISPARSSRISACSACPRRRSSLVSMTSAGRTGGKSKGTKASIFSPPAVTLSYRPVVRFGMTWRLNLGDDVVPIGRQECALGYVGAVDKWAAAATVNESCGGGLFIHRLVIVNLRQVFWSLNRTTE